jgi:hypothetical protein
VVENSLGDYIARKNIASIDIHVKTGIPTSDISRYKNGRTIPIPAERIYLISLIADEPLKDFLTKVYSTVKLQKTTNQVASTQSLLTTPFGKLINSLDDNTFSNISYKTGIKVKRLKDLCSKETAIILGHELLLLELATNVEPGTYFVNLYGELTLNDEIIQEKLREEEKERSRRNKNKK